MVDSVDQTSKREVVADYTVSDVAKILKRSRDSVTLLITSLQLDAYDASPSGKLRQWRVPSESLQAFREDNRARPAQPRKKIAKSSGRFF